ncbi:MAG: DUF1611 domain-containing protein, partial [Blastocatellia bacterium]
LAQNPVIALTINHEAMTAAEVAATIADYEQHHGKPTTDVLLEGCDKLVSVVRQLLAEKSNPN